MQKVDLKLDWCNYQMAKYACENFHYAKKMVTAKTTRIGVWENGKFIGVIIYGRGANNNALKKYGLSADQGCELMRVALTSHTTPVTRIMAISRKMLLKLSPGLKLCISYADPAQGHEGTIYKADNWIYEGLTDKVDYYIDSKGEELHWRKARFAQKRGEKLEMFYKPGKHKYIYWFDKRVELESKALPFQGKESGAVPTNTHQGVI
jgi:hypothetical protein